MEELRRTRASANAGHLTPASRPESQRSAAQPRQRVFNTRHRNNLDAVDRLLRFVGLRNHGAPKPKLGRFPQSFLATLHWADLARQPDFTKHQRLAWQRGTL